MPNHVTNEISVIGGSNKQRLAFIRAITNKHGLLDFNNITRMPKSMHIDESSDVEKMATAIAGKPMTDLFFDDVKTVEEVINSLKERGAESSYIKKVKEQALMRIDNKLRYGFYSWYDWSRVNGEQNGMLIVSKCQWSASASGLSAALRGVQLTSAHTVSASLRNNLPDMQQAVLH